MTKIKPDSLVFNGLFKPEPEIKNPVNPVDPARPVKCLPNEMRSLFHRGKAYLTGVKQKYNPTSILSHEVNRFNE